MWEILNIKKKNKSSLPGHGVYITGHTGLCAIGCIALVLGSFSYCNMAIGICQSISIAMGGVKPNCTISIGLVKYRYWWGV